MAIMNWIRYALSMDMDIAMARRSTVKDAFYSSPRFWILEQGASLASTAELVGCICSLLTADAQVFLSAQVGPVISVATGLRNLNRDEGASRLSPARAGVLLAAVELGHRLFPVMRPHPQNLDNSFILENLINQPMVNVNAT